MAVLTRQWPTLYDRAQAFADGKLLNAINVLSMVNTILDDAPVMPANMGDYNLTSVMTGLPKGTWRLFNAGIPPETSSRVNIRDTCGNLEGYAEVDKTLADGSGDPAGWRASEDRAFVEGMSQTMATTIFYGNQLINPERFTGFSPRFNTVTAANAQSAMNVIDAGGTSTNNCSIWLIVWGENSNYLFFPRGSTAGISVRDLGEDTLLDATNGRYQGYRTHFQWQLGLASCDWRQCVRIANINTTNVSTLTVAGGAPDLISAMQHAVGRVYNLNAGQAVWYMNRTAWSAFNRQASVVPNLALPLEQVGGKRFQSWMGMPIKIVDALLNTEARVVYGERDMLIDALAAFSLGQALTSTGGTDSTNTIDLGADRDIAGAEDPLYLYSVVTTTFTSGGSATLTLALVTATDSAFTQNVVTLYTSPTVAVANLTAGTTLSRVGLPFGIRRYLKVTYTVATAAMTTGAVETVIVDAVHLNKQYPVAVDVSTV